LLVSVIIPIYNEEENIQPLYNALTSVMDAEAYDYELLFIDDGSSDRTFQLLQPIAEKDSKVELLSFRRNFGKASAWAAGFDQAKGDVVVTIDGDLQNDPKDIPNLVSYIGEYDVVNGWRKLISKVTGVNLHDYGSGLKAYKADVVKNINIYGEMHRFIPAVANWYGVKIKEVETTHHARTRGKSKYGISRTLMVILDLITVKFLHSYSTKPLQALGPIGLFFGLSGLAINLYLAVVWFSGQPIGHRPLLKFIPRKSAETALCFKAT
jgi:glycosyltransferase involved in cell wall biosynthesis